MKEEEEEPEEISLFLRTARPQWRRRKKLRTQWNDGWTLKKYKDGKRVGGCKLMAVLLFFTILSSHREEEMEFESGVEEKAKARRKKWKRRRENGYLGGDVTLVKEYERGW